MIKMELAYDERSKLIKWVDYRQMFFDFNKMETQFIRYSKPFVHKELYEWLTHNIGYEAQVYRSCYLHHYDNTWDELTSIDTEFLEQFDLKYPLIPMEKRNWTVIDNELYFRTPAQMMQFKLAYL